MKKQFIQEIVDQLEPFKQTGLTPEDVTNLINNLNKISDHGSIGLTDWRRLALQFDNHRMQALGHLKVLLSGPQKHNEQAAEFLKQPPLAGYRVLAQQLFEEIK
jgi:hypothetical protein